jgi:hypothetical protein
MDRPSRVFVLVEDEHHRMLIYRYLRKCRFRFKGDEMRIRQSPSGRGNAEGWVRKEFPKEVSAYRDRQASRAGTALIVMIDAHSPDPRIVDRRLTQLDQALLRSGMQRVGRSEQIARLVPKYNVETWILCLCNEDPVNEEEDYKSKGTDWNNLIRPAARTLCQWTRSSAEPPNHCVSSLRIGVRELKRLRF